MAVTFYHSDAIRYALSVVFMIIVSLKLAESWLAGEEGWLADYYPEEGGTGYHYSQDGEDSHSLKVSRYLQSSFIIFLRSWDKTKSCLLLVLRKPKK